MSSDRALTPDPLVEAMFEQSRAVVLDITDRAQVQAEAERFAARAQLRAAPWGPRTQPRWPLGSARRCSATCASATTSRWLVARRA